jgi:hypothetical protein
VKKKIMYIQNNMEFIFKIAINLMTISFIFPETLIYTFSKSFFILPFSLLENAKTK